MVAALAAAAAATAWVAVASEEHLVFVPLAIIGMFAVWVLFRHPTLNLAVLVGSVVVTLNFEAGFQPLEVLYGLYFIAFMCYWFVTRLADRGLGVFESKTDVLLALFLLYVTASFALTIIYDGEIRSAVSEWVALLMLALYFPVREFCRRDERGAKLIVSIVCGIGVFVAIRNGLMYQQRLNDAEHLYQIATGRVMMNDNVLMVTALAGLVVLIFSERMRNRGLALLMFSVLLIGLVLTQSRTFWVAFAFGGALMLFLVEARYRKRILKYGAVGGVVVIGAGLIFFGDLVSIIFAAMLERVVSIGSAASSDISLRSRAYEAMGAFEHIRTNPILGHGLGVPFDFFDIITKVTKERTFIHNAYVSLLYRFGVIGTGLLLTFWALNIKNSFRVARDRGAGRSLRVGGVIAFICLLSFVLSANASNPFFLMDALFIFGVLTGLATGCFDRRRDTSPESIDHGGTAPDPAL